MLAATVKPRARSPVAVPIHFTQVLTTVLQADQTEATPVSLPPPPINRSPVRRFLPLIVLDKCEDAVSNHLRTCACTVRVIILLTRRGRFGARSGKKQW